MTQNKENISPIVNLLKENFVEHLNKMRVWIWYHMGTGGSTEWWKKEGSGGEGCEECVMRGGKGGEVWERRFLLPRLVSVIAW